MAKCERREIRPEPPPVEYVLTLTEDEASQVRRVCGEDRHALTARVMWALIDAEVPRP